MCVKLAD